MFDFEEMIKLVSEQTIVCIGDLMLDDFVYGEVSRISPEAPAPILAVTRISGQFFAFLAVKDGNNTVARQKLLKVGDTLGNDYVVLDGLKPGDHIITSGLQFLQDGMPVMEQVQQGKP